jgi:tetratricopeptide (TPR) repeat protein
MPRFLLIPSIALATVLIAACSDPEDRARSYLESGVALYEQGDLVRARLQLQNVLEIDPDDAEAWFLLARIAEQQEQWRGAFSAYQRAVELNPDNLEARVQLGNLQLAANLLDGALEQARIVLETNPDDAGALALRGVVRLRRATDC